MMCKHKSVSIPYQKSKRIPFRNKTDTVYNRLNTFLLRTVTNLGYGYKRDPIRIRINLSGLPPWLPSSRLAAPEFRIKGASINKMNTYKYIYIYIYISFADRTPDLVSVCPKIVESSTYTSTGGVKKVRDVHCAYYGRATSLSRPGERSGGGPERCTTVPGGGACRRPYFHK